MIDSNFASVWFDAVFAVRNCNRATYRTDYTRGPRYWWTHIEDRYPLHPVIARCVAEGYRPKDWQLMLLEWPHISEVDQTQIAYTRTEEAGIDFLTNESKRQTRTGIGKYLARHYPHIRDDIRRDWAGRYAPAKFEIWDTMEGIIAGVELGPVSCMKSSQGNVPFTGHTDHAMMLEYRAGRCESHEVRWDRHPYICYAPEYGWAIAVRLDKGQPDIVLGRALVNKDAMQFVRSFKQHETDPNGYSYSDEKLESWLKDQGYSHDSAWNDGLKLKRVAHPQRGEFMAPYIDGGTNKVDDRGTHLVIDCDGNFVCDNTDGTVSEEDQGTLVGECQVCGENVYEEDDSYRVLGRHGAEGCLCERHESRCTEVLGDNRRGGEVSYYVRDGNAVEIDGEWYDSNNLPDCIVTDADGEPRHEDSVVKCADDEYRDEEDCVRINDEWYAEDSDDIVECRDTEYRLKTDCWEDYENNEWYSNDTAYIDIDGNTYHPDTVKQWLIDAGQMNLELEY